MFNYDKLEEAIKASGKTRTYLCQKINRPPYYLRDVIRQRNKIPEDQQEILASELGVSVAYLNDEPEADKKEKSDAYSDGLTGDQRKAIEKILNMPPNELSKKMNALEAVLDM